MDKYNINRIMKVTIISVIIIILFFYLGIFSPLKRRLEDSLENNFYKQVSIYEISIESQFSEYIEESKSLSSRTMIKNKLIEYDNQEITLDELKKYTKFKYLDGVQVSDDILAAYRVTKGNQIVVQYGNLDFDRIKSFYNHFSNQLNVGLIKKENLVIIDSPILAKNGKRVGNDLIVFDINEFMQNFNKGDIKSEIIYNKGEIKKPFEEENYILEYRKILNTNYWLKVVQSEFDLYDSLDLLTVRIGIVFIVILMVILIIFYRTISNAFNQIISELKLKIKKLNETKVLLENQYKFQRVLAGVSSDLVNLSTNNFDKKINGSLAEIGQFFDIDFIQIFKFTDDEKFISSIHKWANNNFKFHINDLQNLPVNSLDWLIKQIEDNDYFKICKIDNLSQGNKMKKKLLNSLNIESAVFVPIYIENRLFGGYIFGNSKNEICQSKKIKYINLFTEVITRAISKNLDDRKIEKLTYYDSLTGLYNRRFFEEEMKRLDTPRKLPFSILVADLNGLKIINDSYGHDKGDEMLKKAAQIIKSSLRKEDILARQGGDEFAVLLPNTSKNEAKQIVSRIKKKCKETKNDMLPISIALGRATKKRSEQKIEEILREADDKMYKNKLSESRSIKSNIVKRLINVLNEKSSETEEHAVRMTKLAFEFGESLGLSNSEQNRLSMIATLHDIGKINIKEKILKKEDKLDTQEWNMIKKHPEYGYKIAKSSEEFAAVAEDILAHHEYWNGKGYPNQLKGEDIPYLARVIFIIDAYDVMTHERPYSKAISKEAALEEIKNCAGSQFDPSLSAKFIKFMHEKN